VLFGGLDVLILEARELAAAGRGKILGPIIKASITQKLVELDGVGHQGGREDLEDGSVDIVALGAVGLLALLVERHAQVGVEDGSEQSTIALGDGHLGENRLVGPLGAVIHDAVRHVIDRFNNLVHIDTKDALVRVLDIVDHEVGINRGLVLTCLLVENEEKAWEGTDFLNVPTELLLLVLQTLSREEAGQLGRVGQDRANGIGVVLGITEEIHTTGSVRLDTLDKGLRDKLTSGVAGGAGGWHARSMARLATSGPSSVILGLGGDSMGLGFG